MKCPNCSGTACRESKWRSPREKAEHPGSHAYRCLDCSYRFIAHSTHLPAGNGRLTGAAAGLLVLVLGGVALGVSHVLDRPDTGDQAQKTASAAASAEASATLQAAQAGNAEAQYRLGKSMLYDNTQGKQGAADAVSWLRRAADNGHTGAMVQLGKLYRTGLGVLQNFENSMSWLRKAAENGDAEGMLELGRMYRTGTGVKQDLVEAYVWFNRAAAALHSEAVGERESVALKLKPEELQRAQARSAASPSQAEQDATPRQENVAQR